jgi:plasmid stabilization system protein ParE
MTTVVIATQVDRDFERILTHLSAHDALDPFDRIEEIVAAMDVLASNPWIGRRADAGRRELVIGRDRHGHLALYACDPFKDEVVILAIRSQKESGYHHP